MAPTSQMSSSLRPCCWSWAAVGVFDVLGPQGNFDGKVQHCPLARRDIGLAIVHRDLVGDQRVLGMDTQNRPVGDHTVLTVVGGAGGHHNHLPFGL